MNAVWQLPVWRTDKIPLGTKGRTSILSYREYVRPAELHSLSAEENCPTENVSSLRSVKGATLPCDACASIPCGLAVRKQHKMLFAASKFEKLNTEKLTVDWSHYAKSWRSFFMMSHINSYTRKKLNNQSANRLFSFLYGESILPSLGIREIPANDINLTPRLLKK